MVSFPRYLVNFDSTSLPQHFYDVLIIGSGVAGLSVALHLGKTFKVAILTKTELSHTTTRYAQGGIAVAMGRNDSPEEHYRDTLETGRGLCDSQAVRLLTIEGPKCIRELMELGISFDREGEGFDLAREGGHSKARVIHAGDTTGSEVETGLVRIIRKMSNIEIFEDIFVIDLLTQDGKCRGVLALDSDGLHFFSSPVVILAAGGMGQLYSVTTNPVICTGDGLSMSFRAGVSLTDVEFIQFHPTALHISGTPRFLISEAVRGEGAYLRDKNGYRFMLDAHPQAELAPRDTVVREMILVMRRTGEDHVYLDVSPLSPQRFRQRFPAIYKKLLESGFDITKDLIPVSPAAHYMSGGVKTNLRGETTIEGLFACGEVAWTGVHGANRLASNSLLEGLVFSRRVGEGVKSYLKDKKAVREADSSLRYDYPRDTLNVNISKERQLLQEIMMECVGVIRSREGLKKALNFINDRQNLLQGKFDSPEAFELLNMVTLAKLITTAALMREESRGSHWREDFPFEDDEKWLRHITLCRNTEGEIEALTGNLLIEGELNN